MERALHILFVALLVAAPLAVGSVHTEVVLVEAGVALAVWVVQIHRFRNRSNKSHASVSLPSLACWLLAVACFVQLVPLPSSVHAWVNPTGHALFVEGWRAMFEAPPPETWRTLSMDPGRTADRGVRWLALGMISIVAVNQSRRKGGWNRILWAVTAGGVLAAAVGAVQAWIGTDAILFVYEPQAELEEATYSTFVNPNHASVFAGLSSLAAFTLAFRTRRQWGWRPLAAGCGVICMLVVFESRSITGIGFYFVALGLLFLLLLHTGRHSKEWITFEDLFSEGIGYRLLQTLAAGLVLAPLVVLGLWLSGAVDVRSWWVSNDVIELVQDKGPGRLALLEAALRIVPDYPLLGSGAGSTERVLPAYVDWSARTSATVPTIEHEPLEWLFQFGLPVGSAASLLFAGYAWWSYRRYRRHARSRYAFALTAALFLGLCAQMHFPFFMLGISVPMLAAIEASGFPARSRDDTSGYAWLDLHWRWHRGLVRVPVERLRWGGAVACVLLVGGVAAHLNWAVDVEAIPNAPDQQEAGDLERLVALVPSDGNLYARAARLARKQGDDEATAVRRAEYAFEREPTSKMLVVKARNYRAAGRIDRAIEAYQRLFGRDYTNVSPRWVDKFLLGDLEAPEHVAEALEYAGSDHWNRAAEALKRTRPSPIRAQFGLALVERRPDAYTPHRILVDAYLDMERYFLAEVWARQLVGKQLAHPTGRRPAGYPLLLRALDRRGKRDEVKAIALEAIRAVPEALGVARYVIDYRSDDPSGAPEAERRAVERATDKICGYLDQDWSRRRCWLGRAWLAESRGDRRQARFDYERIATELGDLAALLDFLARTGQCVDMEAFRREWSRDHPLDDDTKQMFERFHESCHSGSKRGSDD